MKVRLPDEDVKLIWDKMTVKEREWYARFIWATKHTNRQTLRELCEEAGLSEEAYQRMQSEVDYEKNAGRRVAPQSPKKYRQNMSEWDYNWEQPKRHDTAQSIRTRIEAEQEGWTPSAGKGGGRRD